MSINQLVLLKQATNEDELDHDCTFSPPIEQLYPVLMQNSRL